MGQCTAPPCLWISVIPHPVPHKRLMNIQIWEGEWLNLPQWNKRTPWEGVHCGVWHPMGWFKENSFLIVNAFMVSDIIWYCTIHIYGLPKQTADCIMTWLKGYLYSATRTFSQIELSVPLGVWMPSFKAQHIPCLVTGPPHSVIIQQCGRVESVVCGDKDQLWGHTQMTSALWEGLKIAILADNQCW